ncbi:MAG: UbiD family decarboxylase [Desulfurococcaceae archaeon]|nr:UbiD family decarboxylase [Desulfurococcaceae archaeon]
MRGSMLEFLDVVDVERIDGTLSRDFEVARVIREWQGRGPVIVYRVEGCPQDSASNLVDLRFKLYKALGVGSDEEAYLKILDAMSSPTRPSVVGAPRLREAEGGLMEVPAVRFYEKEAGLYLSSAIFIACYDGVCNASIHRVLVKDKRVGVVRVVPRHLWELYLRAKSRGQDLPVSVVIGVHPAIMVAAASSPRFGVFEVDVASKLLGNLWVYESPIHGNPVPLGSAVVIEGLLSRDMAEEGPYLDVIGTYDRVRNQPVLKVLKVYLDVNELTHVILSGGLEASLLIGFTREAAIWEAVSKVVARVHKVRLTPASGGWLHAIISIDKRHEGDAKNAIMAAFAAHPSLKHVIVVDSDIDPDDPSQVEWAIATRFQADEDLVIVRNVRGSTLDPSSRDGLTAKMGIDATKPLNAGMEYEKPRIP